MSRRARISPRKLWLTKLLEDRRLRVPRFYNDIPLQLIVLGERAGWGSQADYPPTQEAADLQTFVDSLFYSGLRHAKPILARVEQLQEFEGVPLPPVPLLMPPEGMVWLEFDQPVQSPYGSEVRGALICDLLNLGPGPDLPGESVREFFELMRAIRQRSVARDPELEQTHNLLFMLVGDLNRPHGMYNLNLWLRKNALLSEVDEVFEEGFDDATARELGLLRAVIPEQPEVARWARGVIRGLLSFLFLIEAGNVRLEPGGTPEERAAARKINKKRERSGKEKYRDYWTVVFVDAPAPHPSEAQEGGEGIHRSPPRAHRVQGHWRVYRKNRDGSERPQPLVVWVRPHARGRGEGVRQIWTLAANYRAITPEKADA